MCVAADPGTIQSWVSHNEWSDRNTCTDTRSELARRRHEAAAHMCFPNRPRPLFEREETQRKRRGVWWQVLWYIGTKDTYRGVTWDMEFIEIRRALGDYEGEGDRHLERDPRQGGEKCTGTGKIWFCRLLDSGASYGILGSGASNRILTSGASHRILDSVFWSSTCDSGLWSLSYDSRARDLAQGASFLLFEL